jgi:hypothetical protein
VEKAPILREISNGCNRRYAMSKALEPLLEAAKKATPPSEAHREEQRRSFAYGNTAFENPLITREMINEQAEIIARERHNDKRR